MFYFSSLSWCTERLCSSRSLRTKLGIWYPSRSSTMPYRKLRGLWISVRAPIKLLTDNSFCESKISCASQCLDQICAPKSMSSELLCRSKLWTQHCLFENLCCIATHCDWNTRSLVISASISQHAWEAAIIQFAPQYQIQHICVSAISAALFLRLRLSPNSFNFWKWPDYCVLLLYSVLNFVCWRLHLHKVRMLRTQTLFAKIVETSTGPPEITTSALGVAFIVFCYTAHCCGQVAQYCLMCHSLLEYIHATI